MVIFRENTEDVYAGLELEAGSADAEKLRAFVREEFGWEVREMSGLGLKPISEFGSKRLVRAAIKYALEHNRPSVTLVHKGNIQKFTEGAFMKWGYQLVREEFSGRRRWLGRLRRQARGQVARQRRHRGHYPPASLDAPGRLRRHCDDELER